jgi:hypothetical protein
MSHSLLPVDSDRKQEIQQRLWRWKQECGPENEKGIDLG